MTEKNTRDVILIVYTTLYREGGGGFERAARTMEAEKRSAHPHAEIQREAVESKKEFISALERIQLRDGKILELHFIGHSGMYGPMFGTTSWPEQFSPYEWRTLSIPFAAGGQAWFHCCRSARWFAPFFARTFGVPVWGNHWYTSFSTHRGRFVPELSFLNGNGRSLYVAGCPGRKSHGLFGSIQKYSGLLKTESMKRFEPGPDVDATYDPVSFLYDDVFSDITVRADEWRWLAPRISPDANMRLLDIGCGNGALLRTLADRIAVGVGVDRSPRMVEAAKQRCSGVGNLSFHAIDGPVLPFPDRSFDAVLSLLSFRYLDWDPIMGEIRRVLAPGGRLFVVDMVTAPVKLKEVKQFLVCKARNYAQLRRNPGYREALRRMVKDPRWQTMLTFNPIRAEHELKWYLESRFPGRRVEVLNIGWSSRILAFDSGPLEPGAVAPMTYP